MVRLSEADRARVAAAVIAAEAGTDGEIVTVVAPVSDDYADIPLQWALLVVFLALACFAAFPGLLLWVHGLIQGEWAHAPGLADHLFVLLILLGLKFVTARLLLGWRPLRLALTPGSIKTRRVRQRAWEMFRVAVEQKTRGHTGVLLYLSLAEHRAELIGDAAIAARITPDLWGEAMGALIADLKDGRPGDGMARAVGMIGDVLHEHFPRSADDTNELPDRVIEL